MKKMLDPQAAFLQKWNQIFLLSCFIAVSIDPLFFYILIIDDNKKCLGVHKSLETIVCVLRTLTDICYLLRIIFQFQTGYVAPSSRVFGRGELVYDPVAIAKRYLSSCFIIDAFSILPLPQVMILFVIPSIKRPVPLTTKDTLQIMVLVQYIPRVVRIFPLFKKVTSTSGILTEAAWAGAAFNLFLYMLASHVIGAFWYLLSIERVDKCWRQEFHRQNLSRQHLYCSVNHGNDPVISNLDMVKLLKTACPSVDPDEIKNSTTFSFGIFADALTSGVVQSMDFPFKFFYCFWWGLSNLRFEETRVKRERRRKYERWMAHRMLPEDLKERIRRYEHYIWQETRGIEEEELFRNLPKDLRRDIKRHLFLGLVRRPLPLVLERPWLCPGSTAALLLQPRWCCSATAAARDVPWAAVAGRAPSKIPCFD
ncbi:hypothetical protein TIFTF001_008811 [Ficus carica]|uniref:Ion transport domain-containing protein n=1 Tax=Ficus carica TaxID=3494 RepID=A0AA87ZVJ7_FICCA|nr:hypothetical protein TIFTF001_008811 [Ficus carica]